MTVHSQTENINETLLIDAMATNTSTTDAATMDCSDIDISIIKEESTDNDTLQMDASKLIEQVNVDIESPSDRNVNIESLPSTSFGTFSRKTDVPFEILPSDTPKKVILKNEIASLGRLLSKKSNAIRKLQKKNWNQQKQIFKLKSVIHELGNKNLISSDNIYTIMQEFGPNEQLINRLFQKTTKGIVPKKYQEEIRKFAITLHFFSGKAYDYVRKKFNNCLPHPKSLSKWYSTIDALPGWSVEALKMIETKAKYSERQIMCALIMDEIAMRKKIEYDGKKYYGYVDFGVLLDQNRDIAREALVFMIVAINDTWKCPLGYFFINVLNGTQKMNLVTQCLKALFDSGMHVVSLTFDGCQANFVMAKFFGCSLNLQNLKTSFDCENHTVQLLPDPSHMIKLVRNTFGDKKIMIDENGKIIDYRLIIKLCELQETEGLHLANKLRRQHIQFFKQKMKVKLATQLLSRSVAESLIFCKDKLNLEDFKNCDATVNFVKIMNDAFDILNSHKLSGFGFKKAVCEQNIQSIKDFAVRFNKYISGLKFDNGQCVVESNRKTRFIGIAVCLQSILNIYDMHINCVNPSLKFLPVYKCSQDHIELFFGSIRSHGGYNNNPTCRQFIAAYKRLLIHAEIREGGLGNCVPLSQINILNCLSSKQKPEDQINNSCSSSVGFLEKTFKDKEVENIDHDHDYFSANTTLSQYCKEVVIYIAGFVSRILGKSLACESCVGALFDNKENLMASLIQVKNRGGLAYPSKCYKNLYCMRKVL